MYYGRRHSETRLRSSYEWLSDTVYEILSPTLRTGTIEDAEECGRIMFEAFPTIGLPDFPSFEVATLAARMLLSHPGFYSVVAELGDRGGRQQFPG
jgi:hypothetical protein